MYEDAVQVIPNSDLIAHDDGDDCACGPAVTYKDDKPIVTHHSLDGREVLPGPIRDLFRRLRYRGHRWYVDDWGRLACTKCPARTPKDHS